MRLGRNLARTLFEYYKVTGVIPATVLAAVPTTQGEDNERKTIRQGKKGRPARAGSRTKGKSQDKSHSNTRSPSNPKDIDDPTSNTNANDSTNKESLEKETDKTVVKLSQLTKETLHNSDSSDIDSSEEEVKVRATRNGTIFQQQYIRRRSSTSNPLLQTRSGNFQTNVGNVGNVPNAFNNNNRKGRSGKSQIGGGLQSGGFTTQPNEVKKAAYQTFDFSILKEHHQQGDSREDRINYSTRRLRRYTHRRSDGGEGTRKIGGGGIVGKKKGRVERESGTTGRHGHSFASETETEAPCLTIIDFNMLIRKSLEGRSTQGRRERGWRGWSSGHRLKESGNVTDGCGQPAARRRNNVRRRRAILLRGTVTDCSPWDEDGSSSDSSSNLSDSDQKKETEKFRHDLNTRASSRKERRNRSPATPILSPSPIFLPQ